MDAVNQSVFVVDVTRPEPGKIACQCLGMADPLVAVSFDIPKQLIFFSFLESPFFPCRDS